MRWKDGRFARRVRSLGSWRYVVIVLIALGILFRVANLGDPVYWVDEVATSMRVSGYTQAEVVRQLATGEPLTLLDLQQFQTIRPDRARLDLFRVLAQSPEHAPLYFVLARIWAEMFGGSVIAMRSLSVVFSLLALPVMYALGRSLFRSALVGWTAIALLALSPFFVAYAQEARPYSLWILLLLLTNLFLWRALHSKATSSKHRLQNWLGYLISLTLSLYTSLLTILIVIGQSLVIVGMRKQFYKTRRSYLLTTSLALLMLSPWLWIVVTRWQTLQDNTIWMQVPTTIWAILGTWFYSIAVLFFDVPVASTLPLLFVLQVIIATATLAFMGYATYLFIRRAPRSVVWFVAASALSVPLLLLLLDLLRDGQASATPRYLMPTHLGILVILAYFLGQRLIQPSRLWHSLIALFLSVGLISCIIGTGHASPYQKSRNLSNADITALLNLENSPQLVTTAYYIQDTISLSYQLAPDISIRIFPNEFNLEEALPSILSASRPTFFFSPTEKTKAQIQASQIGTLESVFQPAPLISGGYGLTLWKLRN